MSRNNNPTNTIEYTAGDGRDSLGERTVADRLDALHIKYEKHPRICMATANAYASFLNLRDEYGKPVIFEKSLYFDFYLPEYNIIIEFGQDFTHTSENNHTTKFIYKEMVKHQFMIDHNMRYIYIEQNRYYSARFLKQHGRKFIREYNGSFIYRVPMRTTTNASYINAAVDDIISNVIPLWTGARTMKRKKQIILG